MVDFSALLKKPMAEVKKPPLLPTGDYIGRIATHKLDETAKTKTPLVRFTLKLQAWPDTVDESEKEGIDLTKRSLRRDFFLSEDSLHRFKDFTDELGVTGDTLEESINGCLGADVLVEVVQKMNEQTQEMFNDVGKLAPAG